MNIIIKEIPGVYSTGDTNESIISFPPVPQGRDTEVMIEASASNAGTIQFNALGNTTSNSIPLAAGERIIVTVAMGVTSRLNVKQTVGTDTFRLSY